MKTRTQAKLPKVVICGRVNVGKSTLFNRLSNSVKSITLDYEGVTRDSIADVVSWRDSSFLLVDTAGFEDDASAYKTHKELWPTIKRNLELELGDASVAILVVDGSVEPDALDYSMAELLRLRGIPVILAINKADKKVTADLMYEYYALHHTKVIGISAEHGIDIHTLLNTVLDLLPKNIEYETVKPVCRVTFLGRPNVGKSSLLNVLLNEERSVVADMPGTTREAITEQITFNKEVLSLTDTPGIRRQRKVEDNLEELMVKSAFNALHHSHVVVLLLDGTERTIVDQELKLAFYAFQERYKALIIVVNKYDLMTLEDREHFEESLAEYNHLVKHVPILFISAKTQKNVGRLLPLIKDVTAAYSAEVDTRLLFHAIIDALARTPLVRNQQHLEVYKIRQIDVWPPTFEVFVNYPNFFEDSQRAFITNIIRQHYPLHGSPIKLIIRKGSPR